MQSLLKAYPSQAYWNQAIALVQGAPGFPDSLTLDVYRLRLATKTLTQPGDYEDYAERALLADQGAEAKRVLDAGFASGILNAQIDGGHAARLQALADKNSTELSVPPSTVWNRPSPQVRDLPRSWLRSGQADRRHGRARQALGDRGASAGADGELLSRGLFA